jgi:hypothetical protein
MGDEKDRLGETLQRKEKAEEDRFFGKRDQAALERLKQEKTAAREAERRSLAHLRCPKCGEPLVAVEQHDVTVEECPACQGIWLDRGELEALAGRERDSWLGRLFFRPRR